MDRLSPRPGQLRTRDGRPLTAATVARLEERRRLVSVAAMAEEMAVQFVTAEWPKGFCRTIPTANGRGTVKLLMQDRV